MFLVQWGTVCFSNWRCEKTTRVFQDWKGHRASHRLEEPLWGLAIGRGILCSSDWMGLFLLFRLEGGLLNRLHGALCKLHIGRDAGVPLLAWGTSALNISKGVSITGAYDAHGE